MADEPYNSASRLYDIVQAAHKIPNGATREVWRRVYATETSSDMEFTRWYAALLALYERAVQETKALERCNIRVHLRWVDNVKTVLSLDNFHNEWGNVRNTLSEGVLVSLDAAAHELAQVSSERHIGPGEYAKLNASIAALEREILASALDEVVKALLTEYVARLRYALSIYRVAGVQALRDALDSIYGSAVRNRSVLARTSEETSVKRLMELLGHIETVMALSDRARQLTAPVVTLLSMIHLR